MKIEINPGDRQLAFLAVFTTVVLVIGLGVAYTDPPVGGNPAVMGHSVDEMDWTNPLPGNLLVSDNVGIGTTSPGGKLHVSGGDGPVTVIIEADEDNEGPEDNAALRFYGDGKLRWYDLKYDSADNSFKLDSSQQGNIITVLGGSTGNVGIGTTNPGTNKLEVVGGPIKATGGLIIETRTTNPGSPATGQMWLCTDPAPYCQ